MIQAGARSTDFATAGILLDHFGVSLQTKMGRQDLGSRRRNGQGGDVMGAATSAEVGIRSDREILLDFLEEISNIEDRWEVRLMVAAAKPAMRCWA